MKFKQILLMVVTWQIASVLTLAVALQILPAQTTFLGGGSQVYAENPYLYSRGNFDGVHYTHIASWGYGYAEHAFFPLYPNLIKRLSIFTREPYLSGVIISGVSFVLALWFLAKLLALDYKSKLVFWTIAALLIFPTSFYFGAVYTESLFLLFVVSAFYFARKGNWLLAGIIGGLAAYTRFVGIFLLPALLVEWWTQRHHQRWSVVYLALIPVGLLTYMTYLQAQTGDPLDFIHSLPLFGSFRSNTIIMLYQVFWRYAKMIWTVEKGTLVYSSVIYEVAIGLLFFVLTIYSFIKLRLSYAIFTALTYLAPTLTGSFVSLPRYILICFPGFIILGNILTNYPSLRRIYLLVCAVAFVWLGALFSRGYWVA